MFDTEKFIAEVQSREFQELQKKWKHLREYFVREKNKEQSIKSSSGAPKKRKTPYLDMLQFLTNSRASSSVVTNIQLPSPRSPVSNSSCNNTNEDSCNSISMDDSSQQSSIAKSKGLTIFQQCLLNSMNRQEQNIMNPNINFLMSLVPEMNTMSERQLFDFKFEIMKLIQKIKYNNNYIYGSGPLTSTYQHQHYYDYDRASYGYMSSAQNNQSQCTLPLQQDTTLPIQRESSEDNINSPETASEPTSIEDIERILQDD
ncbi:unnamed protein product [Euphydryas editha]|uniref:BESS domain-containing protein n=1 Tax=Euphydryas editha TaxID=104508 RepID=A0AAU9URU6_EUPED|nr:unnamed protein product [Euphydryas editha]